MRLWAACLATLAAGPALAQEANDATPSIRVVGVGSVATKPDMAQLTYSVSGEGKTADEASAALAGKQKAIVAGLSALLGRDTHLSSGEASIVETRTGPCDNPNSYNSRPRLSEGPCAVTGYLATLQGAVRTRAVDKAATAAGLAARLGARDARVASFLLSDPADAQRRAAEAAILDARTKAEAMAAGAKVRLGGLLSLTDQNGGYERVVGESRPRVESLASNAPPGPPPVEIGISPRAIETMARVSAQYAIER